MKSKVRMPVADTNSSALTLFRRPDISTAVRVNKLRLLVNKNPSQGIADNVLAFGRIEMIQLILF
jgi:hypothetical protein